MLWTNQGTSAESPNVSLQRVIATCLCFWVRQAHKVLVRLSIRPTFPRIFQNGTEIMPDWHDKDFGIAIFVQKLDCGISDIIRSVLQRHISDPTKNDPGETKHNPCRTGPIVARSRTGARGGNLPHAIRLLSRQTTIQTILVDC